MARNYIISAFAGALLLGLGTAALAATGEFDNMCTEGLALGKDVHTDCSVNAVIGLVCRAGPVFTGAMGEARASIARRPRRCEQSSGTHAETK